MGNIQSYQKFPKNDIAKLRMNLAPSVRGQSVPPLQDSYGCPGFRSAGMARRAPASPALYTPSFACGSGALPPGRPRDAVPEPRCAAAAAYTLVLPPPGIRHTGRVSATLRTQPNIKAQVLSTESALPVGNGWALSTAALMVKSKRPDFCQALCSARYANPGAMLTLAV